MRIAIPQYEGTVSQAYELSRQISVHKLDFRTGTSTDEGLHDFSLASSFGWLADRDVQAILVGTIDPDNAEILSQAGVHVFTGADDLAPAENVERFIALMREAIARRPAGGCCGGHGGCHDDAPSDQEHGCCGGHGNDDHECCGGVGGEDCCGGGHDHDGAEGGCCGGHGESDDHECCGGAGHDDPDHVCRCR